MRRIGCNHTAGGISIGGFASSFDGTFSDEQVMVESGIDNRVPCVIGDITDAYDMLKEEINRLNDNDFNSICNAVLRTVCRYFGDFSNVSHRMDFFKEQQYIRSIDDIGKVSSLKGQNASACVERSMLSQNLLKSMGFESYYKCTGVLNNGRKEIHAFNLLRVGDEAFIFDTTMPTVKDGEPSPIITKIPLDVFNAMKSPEISTGYSVVVHHYDPLGENEVDITYDAGRANVLDATKQNTK